MTLPYYPVLGSETIESLPGYYNGYFCNFPPNYGTPYDFVPAENWIVISSDKMSSLGGHGCCDECTVTIIELRYIGDSQLPVLPLNNTMMYIIIVAILYYLLIHKK